MTKRITLTDVAADAGVSAKTVSDVIHHRGRMREETRERVRNSMRTLGYTTNLAARTLRTGSAKLIGLAIPNFAQPFNGAYADTVTSYAWTKGYRVSITTYHRLSRGLRELSADAYRFGVDGWIFLADTPIPAHDNFLDQDRPVVLTGDYLSHGVADTIMFPNVEASQAATTRLFELGCERIGFIGAPANDDDLNVTAQQLDTALMAQEGNSAMRLRGYLTALLHHDRPLLPSLVGACTRLDRSDGEKATLRLLDAGAQFDALFCANDAVALGAMSALTSRGLRIPNDVQVIGFDNTPDATFSSPRLTTIDPFTEQYAQMAVDCLISRLEGDETAPTVHVTDFALIERDSTRR